MYSLLKLTHVTCAALSIGGFLLRGYWMMTSASLLQHRATRTLPHVVDTVFLLSGVAMLVMLSLNPFVVDWLVAKFVALVAYVGFGTIALRRGRTRGMRMLALAGAIAIFAYILGVALSHSPASWLAA